MIASRRSPVARALVAGAGLLASGVPLGTAAAQLRIGWDVGATMARVGANVTPSNATAGSLSASRAALERQLSNVGWLQSYAVGGLARFDRPFLSATGDVAMRAGSASGTDGGASLLVTPPVWHRLRLAIAGDARRLVVSSLTSADPLADERLDLRTASASGTATVATWSGLVGARLSYAVGRAGRTALWLGADALREGVSASYALGLPAGEPGVLGANVVSPPLNRAMRLDRMASEPDTFTVHDTSTATAPLRLVAGLAHRFRNGAVSIALGSRQTRVERFDVLKHTETTYQSVPDSMGGTVLLPHAHSIYDSTRTTQRQRWSEVETRGSWTHGRVFLEAMVGARPAGADIAGAAWGQASGAIGVGARTAIVAAVGVMPVAVGAPSELGAGARRVARLGLRLAPTALWRPARPDATARTAETFAVRRERSGEYAVTLQVPNARTVELSGDFTGWKPTAFRQVALDRWELVVHMAPGTHRCNVRVDGAAWIAPPGALSVDDDFNGRVGVIVVD